eukprot:TRINITY_DN1662_c0_g1_i1.p1 TRINITY_DN1662_c0_g1~~TRINITY_DN1662_c0_g1_i1.p1  ORF type:complete len:1111 (-),score=430.35 TRINITY_DN1662_c0_g1_i1:87-3266(-)
MKPALKIKKSATTTQSVHTSPRYFADALKLDPNKELLTALRVRLGSQTLDWLKEFLELEGASILLAVLKQNLLVQPPTADSLHNQALCIHSLKFIVNTRPGLDAVVSTTDSVNNIALCLDTSHTKTRIMVLEMLAALIMLHAEGHQLVVAALAAYKEFKHEKKLYQSLVQGMDVGNNVQLQTSTLSLINAMVNIIDEREARVGMRNQFKKLGIQRILYGLKDVAQEQPDLATQVDVFLNEGRWDDESMLERALDGPMESDPVALGRMIKERIEGSQLSQPVITILNLLARLAGDEDATEEDSMKNVRFVEKLMQKIVMNKQGIDWQDDELLEHVLSGTAQSGDKVVLLQKELEQLKRAQKKKDAQLREKDLLLAKLAKKLKSGGGKGGSGGSGSGSDGEGDGVEGGKGKGRGKGKSGETKEEAAKAAEVKAKEAAVAEAKKTLQLKTGPMAIKNEDASTDAPASDAPAAPLPPGVPPPPPPPGMKAPATPERCIRAPSVKMKGLQWTKMRSRQVAGTFWTKVDYHKYDDQMPWEEIEDLFAAVVITEKPKEVARKRDVTIIDPKRAQNVGIMLSRFKCSIKDISQALLTLDVSLLDLETVTQLVKYIPQQEELDAITAFVKEQGEKSDEEKATLGKPELFFLELSTIPKLAQRVELLHFKLQFPEKLYAVKPDIRKMYMALKQLVESPLLFSVLEFTLLLGNFINFGTRRGNASGYKIEGLNRLADTRSSKRQKFNLVHYVTQWIEKENPDLLEFPMETEDVPEAATLVFNSMAGDVRELRKGLSSMEKALEDMPSAGSDDVFNEVMSTFLISAKEELEDAETLVSQTENQFQKALKHYAEDAKMQPEELLCIFKRFTTSFDMARKDLDNERVLAEKAAKRESDRQARMEKLKEAKANPKAAAAARLENARLRPKPVSVKSSSSSSSSRSSKKVEDDSDDDDEYAEDAELMDFIRSAVGGDDDDVPSKGDINEEDEGMLDDVLAMIRDGDFHHKRRMSKASPASKPLDLGIISPRDTQGSVKDKAKSKSKLAQEKSMDDSDYFSDSDDDGLMSDDVVPA